MAAPWILAGSRAWDRLAFCEHRPSVFIAVLFHTMSNIPYGIVPNYGSYYDPMVTFLILVIAAGTIVVLWGSTLDHAGAKAVQHKDET